MTHEKALDIATRFMDKMNPERWDGVGDPPSSFNESESFLWRITDNIVAEFYFQGDNYGYDEHWGYGTVVELLDNNMNECGHYTCGDVTDSVEDAASMLMWLCDTYIKEETV